MDLVNLKIEIDGDEHKLINTVGALRKALEEFEDADVIYTARECCSDAHHGVIFQVVRDNCCPYDSRWCAKLTILE